jgi:diguanylate cyclase (GGDEF)-like protein
MASLRWYPIVFLVAIIALVGGATLIERSAIDRLLHDDAVWTGRQWTETLAGNIEDLQAIAAGKEPSTATRSFLDRVKKVGRVFLYKIYDADGRIRFVSDDLPAGATDEEGLSEHNAAAAEAIAAGEPMIEAGEGTPPSRPPFFSEAYVPLIVDGKVRAVVETYIDQTEKRGQFRSTFIWATTALGGMITLAFGVPAAAWYFRGRDKKRADAHIQYLANYDALTGLANRVQLTQRLTRALAGPESGRRLAVHSIDIDRFKDINDTLGHAAGDQVIKTVADRLRALAGPEDIVARLGGDEFAIVQTSPGRASEITDLARRVVDRLAMPVPVGSEDVRLTCSVGVAIAPDHGTDAGRLLKSADLALSKAKADGRDHLRVFSGELDNELDQRLTIERAIKAAIDSNGFLLHFQPEFRNAGGRLVGFEALLRLPTKDGFIPPAAFIPVAETMGLIDQIGAWAIGRACGTAAAWPEHLMVAVNLSPAQFAGGSVSAVIAAALKESGLAPHRLEVEITESLLMRDTEAVLGELAALKALGVSIVMDDFGTGYSSLNYLWRFPFDKIKIDASFMRALDGNDQNAEKIVRTVVALGRSLRMRVTVEGVENARQVAFVSMTECDEVQGYFFGRPMPASEVAGVILGDYQQGLTAGDEPAAARRFVG